MNTVLLPECPKCGRRDKVMRQDGFLYAMAAFLFLAGFFTLITWFAVPFVLIAAYRADKRGVWKCRNCFHTWTI